MQPSGPQVVVNVVYDGASDLPRMISEMGASIGRSFDSFIDGFRAKGGPVREIRPGDTVWIPPGEKHWHGAAPQNAMVHLAFQEALDGKHIEWMELVTDAEYSVAPAG
jgi:hypothetical protein